MELGVLSGGVLVVSRALGEGVIGGDCLKSGTGEADEADESCGVREG